MDSFFQYGFRPFCHDYISLVLLASRNRSSEPFQGLVSEDGPKVSHICEGLSVHLCGYIHTIWSSAGRFLRSYYGLGGGRHGASNPPRPDGSVESAMAVLGYFREIASEE